MSNVRTIGPAALDSEFRSPEELGARLESEYGAHLAIMDQRLDEALRAAGFDGAIIFAGDEKIVFRDDQPYPFRTEPYFKAWVPLTSTPGSFLRLVPGQRPMLVYKQLEDYWHEPPSDPTGYWTSHFDIRVVRTEAEAQKLSGAGPRWVAIGETAGTMAQVGTAASQPMVNDPKFLQPSRLLPRGQDPLRDPLHARRAAHGRARPQGRGRGVRLRRVGARAPAGRTAARREQRENELPYGNIIALNEHAATLHYQHLRTRPPAVDALAAHRRRRASSTATRPTSRARTPPRAATTSAR